MLERIANIFSSFLDTVLPVRDDFKMITALDAETIAALPRATASEGMPWIRALFSYKDKRVRAIIWELKYRGNTALLSELGRMLYDEIISALDDIALFDPEAKFLLLPIPMTAERRRERGYNQSEYIAKAILEHDIEHAFLYAPQWFSKAVDTPRQSRMSSRSARLKNLRGSFLADRRIAGHYVILVDDVTTTGSTFTEARESLLSLGAINVLAFTVAH